MPERLVDAQGNTLRLGTRLGSGGEGEVWSIQGDETRVAKILIRTQGRRETHDKIRTMLARPPPGAHDLVEGYPILTWPQQILYEGRGHRDAFVGYTMRRVEVQKDFVPLYQVVSAARRNQLGGSMTWDRLLVLGLRICHVVRTLHRMHYAIGDLNDRNILVSRRLTPLFLDTDSFEVPRGLLGRYPCRVGDRLYWPPELLGIDLKTHQGSRLLGDRYSLAVLLFQLMLNGMRPYQARGRLVKDLDTLEKKTLAGVYPWSMPSPGRLEPPAGAPDYQSLPRGIRRGFEASFVSGHQKPRRRPSADQWYTIFKRVIDEGFATCRLHPAHRYVRSQPACPWCMDPNDPFLPAHQRHKPRKNHPWVRSLPSLASPRLPDAVPRSTLRLPQHQTSGSIGWNKF